MDNELKDIVAKLDGYSDSGWLVKNADQLKPGEWQITIIRKETKKEAADDNN